MLMCTGKRPDTSIPCVGIVGTRHATYAALQEAFRFGMEAVRNGMSVVSGFAEGIDQAGMTGAIHGEGPCIGILACGHSVEYPCLTMDMRKRIIDAGGCVLSRFAPQSPSYKSNFISRNMIIAAYSTFLIAVQADLSQIFEPLWFGLVLDCTRFLKQSSQAHSFFSGAGRARSLPFG